MDEQKWKEYEKKKTELSKRYKKLRLRSWMLCCAYAIVVGVGVWLLFKSYNTVWVGLFIFLNSACSLFLALNQTAFWRKEEEKQLKIMMDTAPMGHFIFK